MLCIGVESFCVILITIIIINININANVIMRVLMGVVLVVVVGVDVTQMPNHHYHFPSHPLVVLQQQQHSEHPPLQ